MMLGRWQGLERLFVGQPSRGGITEEWRRRDRRSQEKSDRNSSPLSLKVVMSRCSPSSPSDSK